MRRPTVVRGYSVAFMAVSAAVSYTSFTTPLPSPVPVEAQVALFSQVPTAVPGPPPVAAPAPDGEALAYLRIPRFGDEWLWTVAEGTSEETLRKGPGHFAGTALPGADGNTAYAGHRSGWGEPFAEFDRLRPGDEVVVSQNGAAWTYEVLFVPRVIEADEAWVAQQNLGWVRPRLTLVTCWPRYGSEKRFFVRAVLTGVSS